MKQLVQNLRTGETALLEIPVPLVKKGFVLIQTRKSLVSIGTERMLVKFGRANWIGKALQQPERLKLVVQKVRSDGALSTIKAISRKINQPIALGYCNVGVVLEVGEGVENVKVGDRVASNGSHGEVVCVSKNLVTKIPLNVSDSEATFTVIGSVALNAIKLLAPNLGETVAVIGTGLIGLLTIDILKANGCKVIAIDIDDDKLHIASKRGVPVFNSRKGSAENFIVGMTNGTGVDGVIITASSTSNQIVPQAARISKRHGKIILVGVVGLNLNRSDLHEKELMLRVSYGYGSRNDADLNPEEHSTASENFQEVLNLISNRQIDVVSLITQKVLFQDFKLVYDNLDSSKSVASIFEYDERINKAQTIVSSKSLQKEGKAKIGIIGAGNYTNATLLPILKGAHIKYIASENGLSGTNLMAKYSISNSTTNYRQILEDDDVDLVMISTCHNLHAQMVIDSLKAGKHVFVEKPLAIFPEELEAIEKARIQYKTSTLNLGFNRRFAPHVIKMKSLLNNAPMNVVATINAGFIPADSWVHNRNIGGGRIIGEACHFFDLITHIIGSKITAVCASSMGPNYLETTDNANILLQYENGSTGVINYFSNGNKAYPKERIEVYAHERTLILDNFKTLKGYGFKQFSESNIAKDKGHKEQFRQLLESVKSGGEPLIPFEEIVNVTKATFAALESLKTGGFVRV